MLDGGSAVSNYIVEKQDKATGKWEPVSKFVRGTKYEVLGLLEGHEYNFRVSAENEYGVGEPLETVLSVVAQHPFSPPGAPVGPLAVSDITKRSCRLAWKPPTDDGGSKITSYLVERQEVGKPYWVTVSSHCKGLYENSQYLFRVAAVTENGPGDFLTAQSPIVAKMPFSKFVFVCYFTY
ncbi:unnamed protein product [Candidula unifasciata]|uniref:Fibronectin type-III domain-containing protein n=1 Tax=Candidula unifasciata TaxID=100452 RepID=A0A8S3YKZ2_9EUPU|nr:unnamed protein product [Candidula unifasciata]